MGALLAAIVSLDPILPEWLPPLGTRWIFREYPFLPAAGVAGLILVASLLLRLTDRLPGDWRRYYLVALIVTAHTRAVPGLRSLNHIVVGGFAALWLLDLVRRPSSRLRSSPVQLLAGLWLAVMVLSTVNGGLTSVSPMVTEVKGILLFLLVLHALETWSDVRFFIGVLVVVSTVSALIGITQEILFLTTGELWVGKVDFRTKNLMVQSGGPMGVFMRPPGYFGFPQIFANALMVAAGLAVTFFLAPGRQRYRGWLAFSLLLMMPALMLAASKGAIGGFVLATLLAVMLLRPRWLVPLVAVAAVGMLIVASTELRYTVEDYAFTLPRIGDLALRVQFAREAVQGSLERHPVLGAGMNKSHRYNPNSLNYAVHNAFLMAMAETGVLGLLVYTALFVLVGSRLARAIRSVRDPGRRTILVAIACGLIALLVHLQADPFYHLQLTWFFLPLAEAAVLTASQPDRASEEDRA